MHGLDWYDYGARNYEPVLSRFTTIDPLAEKYYSISPYAYCAGNPVMFVDPDGRDNYYIHKDGNIRVDYTDDTFNRYNYITKNADGKDLTNFIGQFEKNEYGFIKMEGFSNENCEVSFAYNVKSNSNSYISGDAMASFIGAVAETGFTDVTVISVSKSDGSSPSPSVSHKNGNNMDLRYLRLDKSGNPVLLQNEQFDKDRQNRFNDALYKFGWKSQLSERYNTIEGGKSQLLNRATHYNKSRHNDHLHIQGYDSRVYINAGYLPDIIVKP